MTCQASKLHPLFNLHTKLVLGPHASPIVQHVKTRAHVSLGWTVLIKTLVYSSTNRFIIVIGFISSSSLLFGSFVEVFAAFFVSFFFSHSYIQFLSISSITQGWFKGTIIAVLRLVFFCRIFQVSSFKCNIDSSQLFFIMSKKCTSHLPGIPHKKDLN